MTLGITIPSFGSYSMSVGAAVPKLKFKLPDQRCDPMVLVALAALEDALGEEGLSLLPDKVGVISLTDTGCQSHVKRVLDALEMQRPRQAFFARASAVMISTYCSMALQSHGPSISLSGGGAALSLALNLVKHSLQNSLCEAFVFLGSDVLENDLVGNAVLFTSSDMSVIDDFIAFGLAPSNKGHMCSSLISAFYKELEL